MLKQILLTIGLFFTNFFVPDFGLQLLVALTIGMLLPQKIVEPIHKIVVKIPGVKRFESFLSKNKRLQTIIPRIIAGYFFTYLIGFTSLLLAYLIG